MRNPLEQYGLNAYLYELNSCHSTILCILSLNGLVEMVHRLLRSIHEALIYHMYYLKSSYCVSILNLDGKLIGKMWRKIHKHSYKFGNIACVKSGTMFNSAVLTAYCDICQQKFALHCSVFNSHDSSVGRALD